MTKYGSAQDATQTGVEATLGAFAAALEPGAEAVTEGLVRVRVDRHLRVSEVEILDESIAREARELLAVAVAETTNRAFAAVVFAAGQALSDQQSSPGPLDRISPAR